MAQAGNLPGAIATARQITPGRALYPDAKAKIDRWVGQIQRTEDEPILAQAEQLANAGQLQEAITVASRISSGRVLYEDAQTDIRQWRNQLQGEQNLQRAYLVAQRGNVDALVDAIQIAQEVPASSPQKNEANQASNRWSWDIFRMAETEASYNLNRAIKIAESVPQQTEAYAQAQLRLREWQSMLEESLPETAPSLNDSLSL